MITFQNAKTIKGEKLNYLTGILYITPSLKLCPASTAGCRSACLVSAGRGKFSNVKLARLRKRQLFLNDINAFMTEVIDDIKKAIKKANKAGMKLTIRLNGTSDVNWAKVIDSNGNNIFELFPDVQFYDYTKDHTRLRANKYENYHLTYSVSELSESIGHAMKLVRDGFNAAVVFGDGLPESYYGMPVVDGDDTDLRFLDQAGVIVGLTAKGQAKGDQSGFVKYNNIAVKTA
jgi:hypothetical protein